jgi:hypothetical protein
MHRFLRVLAATVALLLLGAPLADARGGGAGSARAGGGGAARSSRRSSRSGAQGLTLVADCVRDDNVRRMRHRDW